MLFILGNPAPTLYFYSSNFYVYTILGHECVHGWVVGIANFYLSAPPPGRLLELPEWWWMLVDTEYSNKLGQTSTLYIVSTKVELKVGYSRCALMYGKCRLLG